MTTPASSSSLLQTIEADLSAGESWLENEALGAGLFLWNTIKSVFIALAPAEGQILVDTLTSAVAAAGTGSSIEQVETTALNTAKSEQQAVLLKAGSGAVQTIIAGLKANLPAAPPATTAA